MNNTRLPFSAVAGLTESHSSTDPSIPLTLRSKDFMSLFTNKIITISEKNNHLLPMNSKVTLYSTETIEPHVAPDL